MDKPAALQQLKDIHMPSPIGWWPLAPGWWVVLILAMIGMISLVWLCWRRWKIQQPKRQALQILQQIETQAKQKQSVSDSCAQVSQLLRRVALTYFPVEQVASLHGDDWIDFLNAHGKKINFNAVREQLLEYPYSPKAQANLTPLFDRTRLWIKQRRLPWLS